MAHPRIHHVLVLVVWCSAEFVQSMLQLRSLVASLLFPRRWQLTAGRYAQGPATVAMLPLASKIALFGLSEVVSS